MQADSTITRKPTGRPFRKGHDPRRHTFTAEECSRGFYAAMASIAERNPHATFYDLLDFFTQRRRAQRGA